MFFSLTRTKVIYSILYFPIIYFLFLNIISLPVVDYLWNFDGFQIILLPSIIFSYLASCFFQSIPKQSYKKKQWFYPTYAKVLISFFIAVIAQLMSFLYCLQGFPNGQPPTLCSENIFQFGSEIPVYLFGFFYPLWYFVSLAISYQKKKRK